MFPAQIIPSEMAALTPMERLHRLAALATELYSYDSTEGLCRDMRVTSRQIARWRSMQTPVPKIVLVALGAMLEDKRRS